MAESGQNAPESETKGPSDPQPSRNEATDRKITREQAVALVKAGKIVRDAQGQSVNPMRRTRRAIEAERGAPVSGRQWRKMRKAARRSGGAS